MRYFWTWLALVILTTLTLVLSFAHLGPAEVPVAMGIATGKSVLVVLFFMHIIEHRPVNRLVLVCGPAFILVLVLLMLADVETRHFPGPQTPPPPAYRPGNP